jgi:hypothetical protein
MTTQPLPINLTNENVPPAVASGKLKNFVPLPSDPAIPLTPEQLEALFPRVNRAVFFRELARIGAKATESEGAA